MKYPVKIDHDAQTIIMSSAFAKKQKFPNTAEFHELQALHNSYPTYKIVTRKIKLNSQKEAFKGLTYAYMEEYITNHDNAETRLKEFNELRLLAQCHSIRYPHIKKWFLEAYPEVAQFKLYQNSEINNIERSIYYVHSA